MTVSELGSVSAGPYNAWQFSVILNVFTLKAELQVFVP